MRCSFQVDGESKSLTKSAAMVFGRSSRGVGGLDMRHRLPELMVRVGGTVSGIADRYVRGFCILIRSADSDIQMMFEHHHKVKMRR